MQTFPSEIEFLTVTSGHSVKSPRSGVVDSIIQTLRPIVLAGRGHIQGWDIQMVRGETYGAAGFTLKRDGAFVACAYVAWTKEGAAEFWPVARQVADKGFGAKARRAPSHLPWLAAVVMPDPGALPFLMEAADLERCLAWTILEVALEPVS